MLTAQRKAEIAEEVAYREQVRSRLRRPGPVSLTIRYVFGPIAGLCAVAFAALAAGGDNEAAGLMLACGVPAFALWMLTYVTRAV